MENLDPTITTQSDPVGILTEPIAATHPSPPLFVGLDVPPPEYPPSPQDLNS